LLPKKIKVTLDIFGYVLDNILTILGEYVNALMEIVLEAHFNIKHKMSLRYEFRLGKEEFYG